MSTKRTRRARGRRVPIPADLAAFLKDEAPPSIEVTYFTSEATIRAAWGELRDGILTDWIEECPGTRPSAWWKFDAPRQPIGRFPRRYFDGKLPEPRRRLGGTGTPSHECLANVPEYAHGLPTSFVSPWQQSYYNGRSRDIHGERIGTEYREGHFAGLAIDPEDPPRFESEAVYLERHGLLLPGEFERLTEAAFEPEIIEAEADPEAA